MATMTTDIIAERMKTIPDFILGKIIDILDSYEKESTTAEGLTFEQCPKCGIVHPKVIKGGRHPPASRCTDAWNARGGSPPTTGHTHSICTSAPIRS